MRRGDRLYLRNGYLDPVVGPSKAYAPFNMELTKSVAPGNTHAVGVNDEGATFSFPLTNVLQFINRNLKPAHDVNLTLKNGTTIAGEVKEFNGDSFILIPRRLRSSNVNANGGERTVRASNVSSYIDLNAHQKKVEDLRRHDNRLKTEEVRWVNRLNEKRATQLFEHAKRVYFRLAADVKRLSDMQGQRYDRNDYENTDENVHRQNELAYWAEVLEKLVSKFPHLISSLPNDFVGHPSGFFYSGNRKNDGTANRFTGQQRKKQFERPTNASGSRKSNVRGSSAKPVLTIKRAGKSKLPSSNIELHHIVTGSSRWARKPKMGQVLRFNGETYWHSNEHWNWPGKGNQVPRYRLVAKMNTKNNKLTYTGAHEYAVNEKKKGTYRHGGPLELYVYNKGHDGIRDVYYVRPVITS